MTTTYYIVRPSPGYLALVHIATDPETGEDDSKLVQLAGPNCAMPDAAFFNLLRAKGFYATMVAENPDRMKRVEGAVGVGRLRSEKNPFTRCGLTNANAHSKAPAAGEFEDA